MKSIVAIAALAAMALPAAAADTFPVRPVRLLVPSTPGGSVDTFARLVGGRLSERWNQQVVVDNRPGAGGVIAAEFTAKANPDGYTLIMGTVASMATNVTLTKNLPYDPVRDLAPITLVATQNLLLLVTPSVSAQSVKELVALAKSQPGKLSFSSAGNGTGGHLSGELFKLLAGIQMLHIPYRGVAPAIIDVVNGQVTMTFASINSALPQMRSNRLRGLAVTGAKRSPAAPELPTMMEAGVKDYVSTTWYGVSGPGALPPALVKRLNGDITAIIATPDVRERIAADGAEPVGNTPEQFAAFVKSEIEKWRRVIEAAGLKPN